jgi:hypothetical protein
MTIHWGALLTVFATSLGASVAVVALVAAALLGLSARTPHLALCAGASHDVPPRRALSPWAGTAVAAVCLTAAAGIVLVGLWAMIAR